MSALFLLNVYYKDEEFYTIKEIEYDEFIDIMENKLSFSKVFEFGIGKPCNLSDQDIIELLDQTLGQGVKEVFSQRIIREPRSLKKRVTEYQSILKKTESYLIFKDIRVKTKWNICQDNLYDFCLRFNGEKPKAKISKNSNNHTDCTFYAKLNKELR